MWTNFYIAGNVMQNSISVIVGNADAFIKLFAFCSTYDKHAIDTKQSAFKLL